MPRIPRETIEKLLMRVQKPARYIGGELNSRVVDDADVRFALSYPDLYEVGMSNNGIRILYDIAAGVDGAACERVFAVDRDFEDVLRKEGIPLYTLETRTPLHETDAVGFNISHELLATGMLQVLDLGGVPILRSDRGITSPIVIAGGEGVSNPQPLFDFVDLFFIGDGEEGFAEILGAMVRGKRQGLDRSGMIGLLGEIPGVLLPDAYEISYEGNFIASMRGNPLKRRIYRGPATDPLRPIIPNMRITQDRAVVEIARGCPNLCKFCHAGYYDLPYRSRECGDVGGRIAAIIDNTGYDELTLSSLSVSDYRSLPALLDRVLPELTRRGVSISLPSLRVDKATLPVIELISEVRKTSLTFAVESASEAQRMMANKRVFEEDLLEIVRHVFARGWRLLKLYFMIGLPGCGEYDEASEIIRLIKEILRTTNGRMELNVTLSPFVPKPHTPFGRERQMGIDYCEAVAGQIRKALPKKVNLKSHDFRASRLEGIIARGDARLGAVIADAYRSGCRFDSWSEYFRYDLWRECLDRHLPGWDELVRARGSDEPLPWDIVDTGYRNVIDRMAGKTAGPEPRREVLAKGTIDAEKIEEARRDFTRRYAFAARYRVRFAKKGMMKFISHMDFMEIVKRGLRMAGAPLSFTQGFNKRERISTGHPLPLGMESECELVDLDLFTEDAAFMERMSGRLPQGIEVLGGRFVDKNETIMAVTEAAEYRIDFSSDGLCARLAGELERGNDFRSEKNGNAVIPFGEAVIGFSRVGGGSIVIVTPAAGKGLRIDALIRQLAGTESVQDGAIRITRSGLFRRKDGGLEPIG